jgi:DNA-binding response OmpR family regulator
MLGSRSFLAHLAKQETHMSDAWEGQQTGKLQHRRVLIVEDKALVAMLLEDEVAEAGAEAIGPAATLEEAFRLAETSLADGGLDAAILDGNLGGEQVLPLADWLEEHGVPFLFASGYGNNLDMGRHVAIPVLAKPFDIRAVVTALQTMIVRQ